MDDHVSADKKICFKGRKLLIMTFFNGVWFEAKNNLPTDRTGRQDRDKSDFKDIVNNFQLFLCRRVIKVVLHYS